MPAQRAGDSRGIGMSLRELARQCHFVGELFEFAASYSRRAEYFDRRAA
jgi:hypothetical protein